MVALRPPARHTAPQRGAVQGIPGFWKNGKQVVGLHPLVLLKVVRTGKLQRKSPPLPHFAGGCDRWFSPEMEAFMRQENNTQKIEPKKKERIAVWLYPSTLKTIERVKAAANCKSRSEFLENAARFYAGYVSGEEATAYLPAALVAALGGAIQGSESRIARLLFKLAVELDMMMNVMAVAMEVDKDELERLRADCVRNVKRTSGAVSFKDAVELQRGAR